MTPIEILHQCGFNSRDDVSREIRDPRHDEDFVFDQGTGCTSPGDCSREYHVELPEPQDEAEDDERALLEAERREARIAKHTRAICHMRGIAV